MLLAATACVQQSTLPSDCDATTVERSATLSKGGLAPDSFDVCKGQAVTITITVQVAGTLHLHGYDDQVPEKPVASGRRGEARLQRVAIGAVPPGAAHGHGRDRARDPHRS